MLNHNKNNNPSDLGPWIPTELTKYIPDENSTLEVNQTQKGKEHLNRLTIRLPRIGPNLQHTSRSKKLAVKLSRQSLELTQIQKDTKNSQSRYGVMNGSVLHFYRKDKKNQKLPTALEGELTRKVSTILVQPLEKEELSKKNSERGHCPLNTETSKKRSLYALINELKSSKELTKIFLSQRRQH